MLLQVVLSSAASSGASFRVMLLAKACTKQTHLKPPVSAMRLQGIVLQDLGLLPILRLLLHCVRKFVCELGQPWKDEWTQKILIMHDAAQNGAVTYAIFYRNVGRRRRFRIL